MKSVFLVVLCGFFSGSLAFAAPIGGQAQPPVVKAQSPQIGAASQQGVNMSVKEAIDFYFKVLPPESMRQEVLLTMPMSIRDKVAARLGESFFRRHVGNALEKTFTAPEIYAMAQFYGSSEGRSVMKKYPVFMKEIVDPVKKEMLEIMEAVKNESMGAKSTPVPGN